MTVQVGKFHHEDGSVDFCLYEQEPDNNGFKVIVFPETGQTETHHNVPEGDKGGEVSN